MTVLASLAQKDAELLVSIAGTEDIWMQTVHASNRYMHSDLVWGARLSDVLREDGDDVVLELTKFTMEPTAATEAFRHSAEPRRG